MYFPPTIGASCLVVIPTGRGNVRLESAEVVGYGSTTTADGEAKRVLVRYSDATEAVSADPDALVEWPARYASDELNSTVARLMAETVAMASVEDEPPAPAMPRLDEPDSTGGMPF